MRTKQVQYAVRSRQYAFTLVELLISVSIFAIIGVVLYSSYRGGVVTWRRINSETALQQKLRYALDRISGDLRNMVFLSNLPFEGGADKIKFVSLGESAANQGIDIARVSYYLSFDEEEATGGAIVRKEETIKNALSLEVAEENLARKEIRETEPQKEQNLLYGVSELKFNYLAVYEESGEDEEKEYEWLDSWEEKEALPMGIKIEFTMTNPEDNSTISLSKRVYIPAGKPIEKTVTSKVEPHM